MLADPPATTPIAIAGAGIRDLQPGLLLHCARLLLAPPELNVKRSSRPALTSVPLVRQGTHTAFRRNFTSSMASVHEDS